MTERRPNRREVGAAATRQEILATARRLFAEHGYVNTSVQEIASEAGVAVQTVYSSVGTKAALLLTLNDLIDEEAGVAELARGMFSETVPGKLLAMGVRLTRQLNERCGDLIRVVLAGAPAEPDVAAALADGMRRHQHGTSALAHRLDTLGALRPGTTPEHAAAVITMMTSPTAWHQLTHDAGWSFDDAEAWLVESLSKLLLARRR